MKFPFIEHTVVALDVRNDSIRWVELNHIGSKISYVSHGKMNRGGASALEQYLGEIKEEIQADAYQLSCSFKDILMGIEVEDMPFFEESEEIKKWIQGRKEEYAAQYEASVEVGTHVVEVDEDHRRCIFQVVNKEITDRYINIIGIHELHPVLITTGISELGYAQIYEESFTKGPAATIVENSQNLLCNYQNGLLTNVLEIGQEDFSIMIEEADSYLKTEEISLDLRQYAIPLYVEKPVGTTGSNEQVSRPVKTIFPLEAKLGLEKIDPEYALACGIALKSMYPNLDGFNFSLEEEREKGRDWEEKKECYRTGVLLFPALIVILLILFAIEGFLDVNLTETNQVLDQLSDKIELVNDKTEQVNLATLSYQQVRNLVDKRRNSARLFELVSNEIPTEVWLQELSIRHTESKEYLAQIYGIAPRETMIADFMGALEDHKHVKKVELLSSRKTSPEEISNARSLGPVQVNQFQLRVEVSY
ncbi:PilN domain-containing protein [Gracilimonas tropica]|uniref:PilN domain-containing protein n=1 Tax=Gracilimonas tropica TaxID=454600 RepID=UPI00037F252B|nr:PilN domain-containing protein [Gracilimonas tropica]